MYVQCRPHLSKSWSRAFDIQVVLCCIDESWKRFSSTVFSFRRWRNALTRTVRLPFVVEFLHIHHGVGLFVQGISHNHISSIAFGQWWKTIVNPVIPWNCRGDWARGTRRTFAKEQASDEIWQSLYAWPLIAGSDSDCVVSSNTRETRIGHFLDRLLSKNTRCLSNMSTGDPLCVDVKIENQYSLCAHQQNKQPLQSCTGVSKEKHSDNPC